MGKWSIYRRRGGHPSGPAMPKLGTPSGIEMYDCILHWDAVENAEQYYYEVYTQEVGGTRVYFDWTENLYTPSLQEYYGMWVTVRAEAQGYEPSDYTQRCEIYD